MGNRFLFSKFPIPWLAPFEKSEACFTLFEELGQTPSCRFEFFAPLRPEPFDPIVKGLHCEVLKPRLSKRR